MRDMAECDREKKELDAQQAHWEKIFSEESDFFSEDLRRQSS
jgi:hypothetical protein